MANTAQARKRARQSEKRRQHNASLRSAFRSAVRKVRKAIDAGDQAGATRLLGEASGAIDRIAHETEDAGDQRHPADRRQGADETHTRAAERAFIGRGDYTGAPP